MAQSDIVVKDGTVLERGSFDHTGSLLVSWVFPEEKLALAPLNVLAVLLNDSPALFVDSRAYLRKTMDLFDSTVTFAAYPMFGNNVFTMEVSFVRDRFAHRFLGLERKTFNLARRLLAKGPKLDPVSLTLAKGKVIRANADARGTPGFIASLGLADCFFPGLAKVLHYQLDDEIVKNLSADQVRKAWEAVRDAPSFATGAGLDKTARSVHKLWGQAKGPVSLVLDKPYQGVVKDYSFDSESATTVVGVAYSLKGYPLSSEKDRAISNIFSDMLQDEDSPLFQGLREKGGFTYAPQAELLGNGNALVVSFLTDSLKKDRALKATDSLMATIGDTLTVARLDSAKKDRIRHYLSAYDSNRSLAKADMQALMTQRPYGLEGRIKAVEGVNISDIRGLAKTLRKIGSYSLVGSFKGGD